MKNIEILGIVAAVLTTGANIPQAVKIIRTKSTKSISSIMYVMLFAGLTLWFIYGMVRNDVPIMLANGISGILTGIILAMKLIAKKKAHNDFPI